MACECPTETEHPCPYQQDVNDYLEDICKCCEECELRCADEIWIV